MVAIGGWCVACHSVSWQPVVVGVWLATVCHGSQWWLVRDLPQCVMAAIGG